VISNSKTEEKEAQREKKIKHTHTDPFSPLSRSLPPPENAQRQKEETETKQIKRTANKTKPLPDKTSYKNAKTPRRTLKK
jgi:hypothetical protein